MKKLNIFRCLHCGTTMERPTPPDMCSCCEREWWDDIPEEWKGGSEYAEEK